MNKLRNYVGILAICATSVIFTGCGDDDNDQNQGPVQLAPDSLANRTYTLTDGNGGTTTLAFDAAGTGYTLTPNGGTADTGTFTAQRSGDVWTVNTASGSSTDTAALTLNFTGTTAGNYQLVQGNEAPVTGTFAQSSVDPNPDPDPNGTNTNGTVQAPATLSSIMVTANGSVTRFDFTGGTTGTFNAFNTEGNSMGSGNFTYTPSGTGANLHLTYPGIGAGDEFDDLNMVFTQAAGSGQPNTFTGTQKIGVTTSPYSGTFTY